MKTAIDIFGEETGAVRREVEAIRGELTHFSGELQKYSSDQNDISRHLREIRFRQKTFQDRIEKVAEKLRYCKTVLATFAS